jgi:hypothetical protein
MGERDSDGCWGVAGASGRTQLDGLCAADELWRDRDTSSAVSSSADGVCRAGEFGTIRIVDGLDPVSVHERVCR